jgi:hypothetical protein
LPSTIEQVHREYGPRGLAVLAVNIEESRDVVAAWVGSKRLSMDVLLDAPGDAARAWSVTATPTTFLVGRDGQLVGKVVGERPWTSPGARALLESLLAR